MPTVHGDGVYGIVHADGAGEFLPEDLQDTRSHVSGEELAIGRFWAWVGEKLLNSSVRVVISMLFPLCNTH